MKIFVALFFLFDFFVFLVFIGVVHASDVVYSQTINSSSGTTPSTQNGVVQTLGTGISGIGHEITVDFALTTRTSATAINVNITQCDDAAYSVNCASTNEGNIVSGITGTLGAASRVLVFASDYTFDSTKYYKWSLNIQGFSSEVLQMFGSAADVYSGGNCKDNAGSVITGSVDCYFVITGTLTTEVPANYSNSYITGINSPTNYSTTASTSVSFSFGWFNTSLEGYSLAGIRLSNTTKGQSILVPEKSALATTGTYTQSMTLISGDSYSFKPYLRSATSTGYVYGPTYYFNVVSAAHSMSTVSGMTVSGSTSTPDDLLQSFSIGDYIMQKFPFNWVTGIAAVIGVMQSQTSTTSLPTMSVNFGYLTTLNAFSTSTPINTTIDYMSTSTWTQLAAIPAIQTGRTLVSGMLWFGLVIFGVREARGVFRKAQAG